MLWISFPETLQRGSSYFYQVKAQHPGMRQCLLSTYRGKRCLSTLSTGSTTITIPYTIHIELEFNSHILYNESTKITLMLQEAGGSYGCNQGFCQFTYV